MTDHTHLYPAGSENAGDHAETDASRTVSTASKHDSPAFSAEHSHEMHDHDERAGHDHGGHDHSGHEGHDPAIFKRKFWLSLALTIPTLVFSTGLQDILGLTGPRFAGSQFIPAVFGIVLFLYGGLVFIRGGVMELRSRQPGMMTLISLGIVVALGYSLAVTPGLDGMDFWWELATLITIMLLGHWIEMSAVMGAQNALGELARLLPDEADVVHGDQALTIPVADLSLDDLVLVRPGAAIPADGEITDGESEVNESLLTGESRPVGKTVGAEVIAGSINGGGALTVRVTRLGGDTALAGIMKLVADAQASKSGAQVLADRAAALLFYVALGAAVITMVVWFLLKPDDPGFVLERVVSVLVIACPHALGLAIPLVSLIATTKGAHAGILVKDKLALEDARRIDVVLFDKTGTLTEGRQGVAEIVPADGVSIDEVLGLAASVEARSEHSIARAIVDRADELTVTPASGFQSLAGRGAEATVDGRVVTVASQRVVTERGISLPVQLVHANRERSAEGKTVVFVLAGGEVLGLIALADVIRPESRGAVEALSKRGVRVAMLTGDSHEVGNWVAGQLGIETVFAEVLPGQKSEVVRGLQKDGSRVAMVGDGVNDAPALTQADVGIAIGAGSDVAIESAGIVLASSDPRAVAHVLTLSRATYRKELQNLWWAAGYNVLGIPLAAGVLVGVGILMPPALAAVFMSVSTIVVALNAQLLRRVRLAA
ncbi:copper-translocating P-type ATPase [Glaciihabitans sp. UYNi722]|uniref:copper-translocating P-type ATPase n=1 Tax=Glaciihabitans sp. UYNi722 TaxID=3156344 RepID=UPI00339800B3